MSARRPRGLKFRLWLAATAHVRVACHWCGGPFPYAEMVADHEPPLALEGSHPDRAVLACRKCDTDRSKATNAVVRARRAGGGKNRKRRKRRGKEK